MQTVPECSTGLNVQRSGESLVCDVFVWARYTCVRALHSQSEVMRRRLRIDQGLFCVCFPLWRSSCPDLYGRACACLPLPLGLLDSREE